MYAPFSVTNDRANNTFLLNRQNIFIKLFHSFRKIIVYLQRLLFRSTFPLRIPYSMRLYKTYIMAFSKRFDFDDVRTSQTHITCHKSKQRERPMRCILCVSGQPAAYPLSHTSSWGFRVARFTDRWATRRPLHHKPGIRKAPLFLCPVNNERNK